MVSSFMMITAPIVFVCNVGVGVQCELVLTGILGILENLWRRASEKQYIPGLD